MKVKVIVGGRQLVGRFTRTPTGFALFYEFDGSDCELSYDGATLSHKKGGEIPVKMDFRQGAVTVCEIGDGAVCGTVEVETRTLIVRDAGGVVTVAADYLLGGDKMKTEITVYTEEGNYGFGNA